MSAWSASASCEHEEYSWGTAWHCKAERRTHPLWYHDRGNYMNWRVFSHMIVLLLTVKKFSSSNKSFWFCFPHSTRTYGFRGKTKYLRWNSAMSFAFFRFLFSSCLFYKLHLLMEASKTRIQAHRQNQNIQFSSFASFRSLFYRNFHFCLSGALSSRKADWVLLSNIIFKSIFMFSQKLFIWTAEDLLWVLELCSKPWGILNCTAF